MAVNHKLTHVVKEGLQPHRHIRRNHHAVREAKVEEHSVMEPCAGWFYRCL